MKEIFDVDAIELCFENKSRQKLEVIREVIENITPNLEMGVETSKIVECVLDRESQSTTGFGKNLAIPHSQIESLQRAVVIITRYNHPVNWESMDGEDVMQSFMILVPKNEEDNSHLKILSQLARKMMNEEFVSFVKSCEDKNELFEYINEEIKL